MAKSNLCQAYNYGSAKENYLHYNQVCNMYSVVIILHLWSSAIVVCSWQTFTRFLFFLFLVLFNFNILAMAEVSFYLTGFVRALEKSDWKIMRHDFVLWGYYLCYFFHICHSFVVNASRVQPLSTFCANLHLLWRSWLSRRSWGKMMRVMTVNSC